MLFIVLYMVVLNFESLNETLKCDHLSQSYEEVILPFICNILNILIF